MRNYYKLGEYVIKSGFGYILFSSLFLVFPGYAQEEQSPESYSEKEIEQAPKVIEQPAYEYYYWPEDDLNNFGLSTMGDGKSGSTLGDKSKRKSNIEANEYLENRKKNSENEPETANTPEAGSEEIIPEANDQMENSAMNTPSRKPLYEWRDENGTLHITNELGEVPPEYQEQFYNTESGR